MKIILKSSNPDKTKIRKKIDEQLRLYYEKFHKKGSFVPGKTRVPYSGRVYDQEELIRLLDSVLDFWLTAGPLTEALEGRFRNFLNSKDFLLVNSGSSANLLMVATICARSFKGRLRKGDEVITPSVTFPTTLGPIIMYGLMPVFVDVDVGTYNISEELIEKAVGKRTRAIFIPHTLGNPCDMDIVMDVAKKKDLIVIEDACDALGSLYGDRLVGTFGGMSSYSFYPAHHMTLGEGGGVSINNSGLAKIARSIRDWGRDCFCKTGHDNTCGRRFSMKMGDLPYGYDHKYIYSNIGYNLKLTEMQSAIGLAQFEKLDKFTKMRRRNFDRYYKGLSKFEEYLILPESSPKARPSWFGFPISVRPGINRLKLIRWLEASKVDTRLMFGGNIIRQPGFKNVKHRIYGKLSNSDFVMNNTFFIGVYPGLTDQMIDYVLSRFKDFFRDRRNWK